MGLCHHDFWLSHCSSEGDVFPFAIRQLSLVIENRLYASQYRSDTGLDFAGERVPMDPHVIPLVEKNSKTNSSSPIFRSTSFSSITNTLSTFFPYIESYFHEISIPDDFKYLAVAESGLRNDAESHAGARGIWQLMPETARRYGLRVDE
jgi:membrane-bound lytic murein transglycosylase D